MATEKQIAANRRNAQKSTGPRTAAGKAVSRRNALLHGLYSRTVFTPEDGREPVDQFVAAVLQVQRPRCQRTRNLLEQFAVAERQLARLAQIEMSVLDQPEPQLRQLNLLNRIARRRASLDRLSAKLINELEQLQQKPPAK